MIFFVKSALFVNMGHSPNILDKALVGKEQGQEYNSAEQQY